MLRNEKQGKIYFIKTNLSKDEKFGMLYEVNSNFDYLLSIQLTSSKAIGVTSNEDILEWKGEKKAMKRKKQDYSFLLNKPVYQFYKMKFSKILVNSSVCLGLDNQGNVMVWGAHKDGLLGLGYNITAVENPTRLENLRAITEMAMCEGHAVVIDSRGEAFSWGSGKYGELGLERTIYSPFPAKVSSDKIYSKVFCSELLTCFLDRDKKFSYFGVIIKIFKGSNSSITLKSLLKDESNSDPNYIFQERIIYELESEYFTNISIGNGFIGLLSEKGLVYTLDHSDNITILYSKYFVYSISVSNNQLFGMCKDSNRVKFPNNKDRDNLGSDPEDKLMKKSYSDNNFLKNVNIGVNCFLCRWIASFSEKDVISDSWTTHFYRISEIEVTETMLLLDSKNKDVLLFLQSDPLNSIPSKLNHSSNSLISPNNTGRKYKNLNLDKDNNNRYFEPDESWDNTTYNEDGLLKKHINNIDQTEILTFISTFDDSYNMKYKRIKNFHGARAMPNAMSNKKKIISMTTNNLNKNSNNINENTSPITPINHSSNCSREHADISHNDLFNFKSNMEETQPRDNPFLGYNTTIENNRMNMTENPFETTIGNNYLNLNNTTGHDMNIHFNNTLNGTKSLYKSKQFNKLLSNREGSNNMSIYSEREGNAHIAEESLVRFYTDSAGFAKMKRDYVNKAATERNNYSSQHQNSSIYQSTAGNNNIVNTGNQYNSNSLGSDLENNPSSTKVKRIIKKKKESHLLPPKGEGFIEHSEQRSEYNHHSEHNEHSVSPQKKNNKVILKSRKIEQFFPDDDLAVEEKSSNNQKHTVNNSTSKSGNKQNPYKIRSASSSRIEDIDRHQTPKSDIGEIIFAYGSDQGELNLELNENPERNEEDPVVSYNQPQVSPFPMLDTNPFNNIMNNDNSPDRSSRESLHASFRRKKVESSRKGSEKMDTHNIHETEIIPDLKSHHTLNKEKKVNNKLMLIEDFSQMEGNESIRNSSTFTKNEPSDNRELLLNAGLKQSSSNNLIIIDSAASERYSSYNNREGERQSSVKSTNLNIVTNFNIKSKENSLNVEEEVQNQSQTNNLADKDDKLNTSNELWMVTNTRGSGSHSMSLNMMPNSPNTPNSKFIRNINKTEKTNKHLVYTFTEEDGFIPGSTSNINNSSEYFGGDSVVSPISPIPMKPAEMLRGTSIPSVHKSQEDSSQPGSMSSSNNFFKKIAQINYNFNTLQGLVKRFSLRASFNTLILHVNDLKRKEIVQASRAGSLENSMNKFIRSNSDVKSLIAEEKEMEACRERVKDNKPLLYFTKILFRILTVFYKEHKEETVREVYSHFLTFSINSRTSVLLKKFLMRSRKKNSTKHFIRWNKIALYSQSVFILNNIYLKHMNYIFFFFKHFTKIFNLKKKYFEEFIVSLERHYMNKKKQIFFNLTFKKIYYSENSKIISKKVLEVMDIVKTFLLREAIKGIKMHTISKNLFQKNFNFFIGIVIKSLNRLKKRFLTSMLLKINQEESLRGLVMKKHLVRIFFLKKTFRALKKFTEREDENVYLNIKLKKVMKIMLYKSKINLLKALFKWNNNATKKKVVRVDKPVFNYKVNDFRNKFRFNKIPGFSSMFSTTDKNEKLQKYLTAHLNKKLTATKYNFLQKIYTFYIYKKLNLFIKGIVKFITKEKIMNLYQLFLKNLKSNSESSIRNLTRNKNIDVHLYFSGKEDKKKDMKQLDKGKVLSSRASGANIYSSSNSENNSNYLFSMNSGSNNNQNFLASKISSYPSSFNKHASFESLVNKSNSQMTFICRPNDNSLPGDNSLDLHNIFFTGTNDNPKIEMPDSYDIKHDISGENSQSQSNIYSNIGKHSASSGNLLIYVGEKSSPNGKSPTQNRKESEDTVKTNKPPTLTNSISVPKIDIKNINLPLSTGFNNMLTTPKFKSNRGNIQQLDDELLLIPGQGVISYYSGEDTNFNTNNQSKLLKDLKKDLNLADNNFVTSKISDQTNSESNTNTNIYSQTNNTFNINNPNASSTPNSETKYYTIGDHLVSQASQPTQQSHPSQNTQTIESRKTDKNEISLNIPQEKSGGIRGYSSNSNTSGSKDTMKRIGSTKNSRWVKEKEGVSVLNDETNKSASKVGTLIPPVPQKSQVFIRFQESSHKFKRNKSKSNTERHFLPNTSNILGSERKFLTPENTFSMRNDISSITARLNKRSKSRKKHNEVNNGNMSEAQWETDRLAIRKSPLKKNKSKLIEQMNNNLSNFSDICNFNVNSKNTSMTVREKLKGGNHRKSCQINDKSNTISTPAINNIENFHKKNDSNADYNKENSAIYDKLSRNLYGIEGTYANRSSKSDTKSRGRSSTMKFTYYNEYNLHAISNVLLEIMLNRRGQVRLDLLMKLKRIVYYAKNKEKINAVKILYRTLKRRIVFYKLRFLHRVYNIYSFLIENNIESIESVEKDSITMDS